MLAFDIAISARKESHVAVVLPSPWSQDREDILNLVRQAQAGSGQAAAKLVERCREPLLAVIRKILSRPLRRLNDSDDFLLETFNAIFTKHFRDEVLKSPESLWRYLKVIAENKVHDAQRKYLGERHDLSREVPLDERRGQKELWSQELSPAEALLLKELVEERLEDLLERVPPLMAAIIELLLQGYNGVEIARRLGLEPTRVYRAIEWLRNKIMGE